MTTVARILIPLRRRCPALLLALGVILGQTSSWWAAELSGLLWGACTVTLLWALSPEPFRSGLILGFVSGLVLVPAAPVSTLSSADATVFIEIVEAPKRGRVGALSLVGRLLHGEGGLVRCRAVDLPWRNASHLEAGDIVSLRGAFHPIPRPRNPFSWEGYLYRQGITTECRALFVSQPLGHVRKPLSEIRDAVGAAALRAVGDSQATGLFLSMAFGYRGFMSDSLERVFKVTGLIHLLVVSGYQVTMVCGLVALWSGILCAKVCSLGSARRVAAFPSLIVGVAYVALCGCEPSSVRALVASACLAVHQFDDHSVRFFQRCGVALLILMLMWPWCFFDMGVQLTFAALVGIALGTRGRRRTRVRSALSVSVNVWCCTGIVSALWGGTVSIVSVPLNIILAAPWSFSNCCGGALGLLLYVLGLDQGAVLLGLVTSLNEVVVKGIGWVAEFEGAQLACDTSLVKLVTVSILTTLLLPGIARLWRSAALDPRL